MQASPLFNRDYDAMMQQLNPAIILSAIAFYIGLLAVVAWLTRRDTSNESFFLGRRQSPWWAVSLGMIGPSLAGISFITLPGMVGQEQAFAFLQMSLGFVLGYLAIAWVLVPLYHSLELTSIYGYLLQRLGLQAHRAGAGLFLVGRTMSVAVRLYLSAIVLQRFLLDHYGVPFAVTIITSLALAWAYTFRGGLRTVIWANVGHAILILLSIVGIMSLIGYALEMDALAMIRMVGNSDYSRVFFFDGLVDNPNHFVKLFMGGILLAIATNGVDQEMVQKYLSCSSPQSARKSLVVFSGLQLLLVLVLLSMGALLYLFASNVGLPKPEANNLFPSIALQHLSWLGGFLFLLGWLSAVFSSLGSSLVALTTSFCYDFLNFGEKEIAGIDQQRERTIVHAGVAALIVVLTLLLGLLNEDSVLNDLSNFLSYTYGPLLGLFAFGFLTQRIVRPGLEWGVLAVCLSAPALSILLETKSPQWLMGFEFGPLMLVINVLLTIGGLWAITIPAEKTIEA